MDSTLDKYSYYFLPLTKLVFVKGAISNSGEVNLAMDLVETIQKMTKGKNLSIGIITFYSKQKNNVALELQNR